jgi:hypothetical protein
VSGGSAGDQVLEDYQDLKLFKRGKTGAAGKQSGIHDGKA